MTEQIMDIDSVRDYLATVLHVKKVQGSGRRITIVPVEEETAEKKSSCPFSGLIIDDKLTVDKFLQWKREAREIEYEKDLRS